MITIVVIYFLFRDIPQCYLKIAIRWQRGNGEKVNSYLNLYEKKKMLLQEKLS